MKPSPAFKGFDDFQFILLSFAFMLFLHDKKAVETHYQTIQMLN